MTNIKKISIIALLLLLVGIIGSFITFNSIKGDTVNEEKLFNDETINNIEISTNDASIEILPSNDTTTKVELTGTKTKYHKYTFNADVQNNTLAVELTKSRNKLFNFGFFYPLSIKVYVPEKVYESVQIKSNNGRIEAKDLQAKDLIGETNNGRIIFANIEGSKVTTEANNGSIELENVKTTSLAAKSDNGKIILADVEGEISGNTKNGRIVLQTSNLDRNIELKTHNGSIKIETDKEPTNVSFLVQISNGKVDIFDEHNGNVVFGNGDNMIKLTTHNGKITVTK